MKKPSGNLSITSCGVLNDLRLAPRISSDDCNLFNDDINNSVCLFGDEPLTIDCLHFSSNKS